MATACALKPTVRPLPPQTLPDVPVSAMQEIEPPAPPAPLAGLSEEMQAKVLLREYMDAVRWGSELAKTRDELIRWIRRLQQKMIEDRRDD